MSRRMIIGAIGGDRQRDIGRAFGAAVARAGCILLSGGEAIDSDQIKDATMAGAVAAANAEIVARLVGIVPSHDIKWDDRPYALFLYTGLPHYIRNVINGMTPDALVAFGGSCGTLAEVAFARAAGKDVYFVDALARLRRNFEAHLQRAEGDEFETYFVRPIAAFPQGLGTVGNTRALVALLARTLDQATDTTLSVDALVAHAADRATAQATGFPGLPGDLQSRQRFEQTVQRISG